MLHGLAGAERFCRAAGVREESQPACDISALLKVSLRLQGYPSYSSRMLLRRTDAATSTPTRWECARGSRPVLPLKNIPALVSRNPPPFKGIDNLACYVRQKTAAYHTKVEA